MKCTGEGAMALCLCFSAPPLGVFHDACQSARDKESVCEGHICLAWTLSILPL